MKTITANKCFFVNNNLKIKNKYLISTCPRVKNKKRNASVLLHFFLYRSTVVYAIIIKELQLKK